MKLTPIAIALATLALSGCGGSDSGSSASTSPGTNVPAAQTGSGSPGMRSSSAMPRGSTRRMLQSIISKAASASDAARPARNSAPSDQ